MNRLLGRIRQRLGARTTVRRRALVGKKVRIRIEFGGAGGSRLGWCPAPRPVGVTHPADICYGGGRFKGGPPSGWVSHIWGEELRGHRYLTRALRLQLARPLPSS